MDKDKLEKLHKMLLRMDDTNMKILFKNMAKKSIINPNENEFIEITKEQYQEYINKKKVDEEKSSELNNS
ncbi:MAG: hypothetical protein CMF62_02845 [Magnetococcales bacterium]|nr:hypothetical protein [Magnetococcales bacterium]